MRFPSVLPRFAIAAALLGGAAPGHAADGEKVTFDDHALPVFRQRCGTCHNPDKKAGGLDLTTYPGLMAGGGSGAVVEAGDPSASYLYQLVTHSSEPKMPPDSPPIPEAEAKILERWIAGGILENKGSKAAAPKKKPMLAATDAAPSQRPAVVPLPARLPLEPVVRTAADGACCSIATSPWAPLAAACGQKQIVLWRTDTGRLAGILPFPEGRPQVVAFSRSGSLVLAGGGRGGASGRVVAWNVEDGRRVLTVGDELDTVLAADISADHALVALGGPQKVVRIHSAATGEKLHDLRKHTDWITALSFSPDGVLLATGDRNGGVIVWEAATGRDYLVLGGHGASVTALSWRPDSNLLASASEDGTIRLWEMENGGQMKNWNAHGGGVAALEFTRDGRLVSVGRDKTPKLWAQDGNQQKAFEACPDLGLAASYCDETDAVVVGDWTGAIRVFKGADAVRLPDLSTNPPTLAERIAAAEKAVADTAPAVEPAAVAAAAAAARHGDMQRAFAGLMSERDAAMARLTETEKQAEAATAARAAAEAARAASTAALAEVEGQLTAAVESHSTALAALAAAPGSADRAAVAAGEVRLRAERERRAAAAADSAAREAALGAADAALTGMNAARDAARTTADSMAAQVGALEPELASLRAAADAAEAARAEAAARLDTARAELARWQDEGAFVGRYREFAAAVTAAEEVLRQAEQAAADAEAKVAADEAARRAMTDERTANQKELETLVAAVATAEQEHRALLERVAVRQTELAAAQATLERLATAAGLLGAAATQAQAAAAAAPGDAELAAAVKVLGDTMAAKAAQMKAMQEALAAQTAERTAWEQEAAGRVEVAAKAKAAMPVVSAKMAEIDGRIAAAAAVVAESTAALEAARAQATAKQAEVDAALTALRTFQGITAK
ncbi:MAG: hypothetical protein FJ309_11135 [Planctomycetes bacterium]|nr:hypothetical protein [Planctomycetota bacterium]